MGRLGSDSTSKAPLAGARQTRRNRQSLLRVASTAYPMRRFPEGGITGRPMQEVPLVAVPRGSGSCGAACGTHPSTPARAAWPPGLFFARAELEPQIGKDGAGRPDRARPPSPPGCRSTPPAGSNRRDEEYTGRHFLASPIMAAGVWPAMSQSLRPRDCGSLKVPPRFLSSWPPVFLPQ